MTIGGVRVAGHRSNLFVTVLTREPLSSLIKSYSKKKKKWLYAIARILATGPIATVLTQIYSLHTDSSSKQFLSSEILLILGRFNSLVVY